MTPETLSADSRVGDIAARFPVATRSLHRFGIDFCCGGGLPLSEACHRKNVDPDELLDDIRRELSAVGVSDSDRWMDRSPVELIDHIVSAYHEPLREELPRLEAMLRKVVRVHGHVDPERLGELLDTYIGLQRELVEHMRKEESDLFPRITDSATVRAADRAASRASASTSAEKPASALPFDELIDEHESAGRALERIRELTDDFVPPEYACNTWRGLWAGLEQLEREMHNHIHLENNVLFPAVAIE